jgi:lipid-A-disaccharide synthase-like uncharacterized protein
MHNLLFSIGSAGITGWHIVGFLGTLLFSARWVVQVLSSHKAGKPVVTRGFWYMSISGNTLILAYFIFGKPDLVGVVSNLFPMAIALYNLYLAFRAPKESSL